MPPICEQKTKNTIRTDKTWSIPWPIQPRNFNKSISMPLRLQENNDYISNFRSLPEHLAQEKLSRNMLQT